MDGPGRTVDDAPDEKLLFFCSGLNLVGEGIGAQTDNAALLINLEAVMAIADADIGNIAYSTLKFTIAGLPEAQG